jgi:hypothetical protein
MDLRVLQLFSEMQQDTLDLHVFRELVAGNDPKAKAEVVGVLDRLVERGLLSVDNDFYTLTPKGRKASGF